MALSIHAADLAEFGVELRGDILWLSIGRYEGFLARGREGLEEMQLYLHLMFCARRQANHYVRADAVYLQRGLRWGSNKVRDVKARLRKLGLISYDQQRQGRAKFIKGEPVRITVHMIDQPRAGGMETAPAVSGGMAHRTCGAKRQLEDSPEKDGKEEGRMSHDPLRGARPRHSPPPIAKTAEART